MTRCRRIVGLPGEKCQTCGQMIYEKSRGARWLYSPILTHAAKGGVRWGVDRLTGKRVRMADR